MKIESPLTAHLAQAIGSIARAISQENDTQTGRYSSAGMESLEIDLPTLEAEIHRWGKDPQPFMVSADVSVYHDDDLYYEDEQYEYDFWEGMKYEIVLTFLPSALYTATAKRIRTEGQEPEVRVHKYKDPIVEIMADAKWRIEEAE